jgi:hypothetical protein
VIALCERALMVVVGDKQHVLSPVALNAMSSLLSCYVYLEVVCSLPASLASYSGRDRTLLQ